MNPQLLYVVNKPLLYSIALVLFILAVLASIAWLCLEIRDRRIQAERIEKEKHAQQESIPEEKMQEIKEEYEFVATAAKNPKEQNTATNDYRLQNEKSYRCEDGDYVRSKGEREIDDFLYKNRIWHIYEPEYIHPKTNYKYYPDFYLTDYNLYIEYFGRSEDTGYAKKCKTKIKAYRSDPNMKIEYIDFRNDGTLKEKLTEICIKHNIPLKK